MEELRRLRKEKMLSQAKLAGLADLDPSTVNQLETGTRRANMRTLEKLAGVLGVEVADFFPKDELPLPLQYGPSLEELHAAAGCATDWLVLPEAEWRGVWSPDLPPREAMNIVHKMAAEISALKPLMEEQERGLSWSRRMFSGHFRQAWLRYFDGLERAKECGVSAGLIGPEGTPKDLAEVLGEEPAKPLEELLLAAS